ncbi:MAG: hypothetical protein JWM80_6192 [Cyanobacteria bacterium RYN_339]|nr:hypothetical protein [Cyanobacteria bacterium RYN_339]
MTRFALVALATLTLATGCAHAANPAVSNAATAALQAEAKKSKADAGLAYFNITKTGKMRDGGTIEVRGYTNKSNATALRVDHALNSKHPGQLTIASHDWDAKGDETFRPVTAAEAKLLIKPVQERLDRKNIMADPNVDNAHLQELMTALKAL